MPSVTPLAQRTSDIAPAVARAPRVMLVQATDAAAYPPVMNVAVLLADLGWRVTVVNAPIADKTLALPPHPSIECHTVDGRLTHVLEKRYFARYSAEVARLAWRQRPDVVYASDQLGAGPGLLAARISGARLIYHEHDSPAASASRTVLGIMREKAVRAADLLVFPNAERARIAGAALAFDKSKLRVVWNLPRLAELPAATNGPDMPLLVYYHGSITPERLPMAVVNAVMQFNGAVKLLLAGYEVASSNGYISRLIAAGTSAAGDRNVQYFGLLPSREQLLDAAARAHVGLALMPVRSDDVNMRHMTGASNKIFDYMAVRLAGVVSDLPDWRSMFVDPGYARACDPENVDQLAAVFRWFIDHPDERRAMASANRAKIAADWNYDKAFEPVLAILQDWTGSRSREASEIA